MTKDLLVAPLKLVTAFCPETLLKNFTLTLPKIIKNKKNCLLLSSAFYESNLQ